MKLDGLKQLVKEELAKALNKEALIPKKMIIANILNSADIPDEAFSPQTKPMAVNFIEVGRPSEYYLNKIVSILDANGIDTSAIKAPLPEPEPYVPSGRERIEVNPYDEPASRGYMGAKYRGD